MGSLNRQTQRVREHNIAHDLDAGALAETKTFRGDNRLNFVSINITNTNYTGDFTIRLASRFGNGYNVDLHVEAMSNSNQELIYYPSGDLVLKSG
jgi:hypothetical protein